jgi:hypothetical protein
MKYSIPSNVLRAEMDGREVLLNPDTGMYHMLNRTGRALVVEIENGSPVEDAIVVIADRWAAPEDTVRQDVQVFLTALEERGLVERDA